MQRSLRDIGGGEKAMRRRCKDRHRPDVEGDVIDGGICAGMPRGDDEGSSSKVVADGGVRLLIAVESAGRGLRAYARWAVGAEGRSPN